jgi:hypothetical protein
MSAGLDQKQLEPHCAYRRPANLQEGELPVNWGWFDLGDGRVCLHRIGYSGTDEIGREGNFLAHNLVVPIAQLEAIDFDLTSLFRWVERYANPRYPRAQGDDCGFALDHEQPNRMFGTDRETLLHIPELAVPVAEVRRLRAEADRNFEVEVLGPLRRVLKPEGLASLLQAYLYEEENEERRSILVYSVGDGARESDLERKVVEFFFGLFPYHCRRKLNFSTYEGSTTSSREAPGGRSSARLLHKDRRLVMSTSYNTGFLPGRSGSTVSGTSQWIINGQNGLHILPPASALTKDYTALLAENRLTELFKVRDTISRFRFDGDELRGLVSGWKWCRMHGRLTSLSDLHLVNLFNEVAPSVRPGYPEILDMGHHAVECVTTISSQASEKTRVLVESFLCALDTQISDLLTGADQARLIIATEDLVCLFKHALQVDDWPTSRLIIEQVALGDRYLRLREGLLGGFTRILEQEVQTPDVPRLEGLWNGLQIEMPRQPVSGENVTREFFDRIAGHLLHLLLPAERSRELRPEVEKRLNSLVLPICLYAPFKQPGDLFDRFRYLHKISGRQSAHICGKFFVNLAAHRRLDATALKILAAESPDLILRFYEAWKAAVATNAKEMGPVCQLLNDRRLPATYWRVPLEQHDLLLQQGLMLVLSDFAADPKSSYMEQLSRDYVEDGAEQLIRALASDSTPRPPDLLARMVEAQSRLVASCGRAATAAPRTASTRHLVGIIAFLLSRPSTPPLTKEVAQKILAPAVHLFCQDSKTYESRVALVRHVAWETRKQRSVRSLPAKDLDPLLSALSSSLQGEQCEIAEADWLTSTIKHQVAMDNPTPEEVARQACADVFERHPGLASPGETAAGFTGYLHSVTEAEVWQILGNRLVNHCVGTECDQMLVYWFDRQQGRMALLAALAEKSVLSKVGSELMRRYAQASGFDPIPRVDRLLSLNPPGEIRETAIQQLDSLVKSRYARIIQEWRAHPTSGIEVRLAELARPLQRVGNRWKSQALKELWANMGRCLCNLSENHVRARFPDIFRLGCAIESWLGLGLEPESHWRSLFGPMASLSRERDERDKYLRTFVVAGESLFDAHDRIEHVDRLTIVYRDNELSQWFNKNISINCLFPIISTRPRPATGASDLDSVQAAVVRRAKLGALLYAEKSPPLLADFCYELGLESNRAKWEAQVTAFALIGCLTVDGPDWESLRPRIRLLVDRKFWKRFQYLCKSWACGPKICATLELWLPYYHVSKGDANRVAEIFRWRMRPWLRRRLGKRPI